MTRGDDVATAGHGPDIRSPDPLVSLSNGSDRSYCVDVVELTGSGPPGAYCLSVGRLPTQHRRRRDDTEREQGPKSPGAPSP